MFKDWDDDDYPTWRVKIGPFWFGMDWPEWWYPLLSRLRIRREPEHEPTFVPTIWSEELLSAWVGDKSGAELFKAIEQRREAPDREFTIGDVIQIHPNEYTAKPDDV